MSANLKKAWDAVKLDGKLTPENIKAPMRDIRRALLEADVSLPVVRGFVKRVEAKALGVKVCHRCTATTLSPSISLFRSSYCPSETVLCPSAPILSAAASSDVFASHSVMVKCFCNTPA